MAALLACKGLSRSAPSPTPSASSATPSAPVYAVFGEAPKNPARVRVAVKQGAIVATKNWPDACLLLTRDDIEAILPGATKIEQERGVAETRTIEEFAAHAPNANDESKHGGSCVYLLQLPSESHPRTRVWVRILAVAHPALIEDYYNKVLYAPVVIPGLERCQGTGMFEGNIRCHSGPLIFEVGGYGTAVFKETEVFGVAPPFLWRDKILPEFARSIAAKPEPVE